MTNRILRLTLATFIGTALLSCSKLGFEGSKDKGKAIRTTHMIFGCLSDSDGGGPLGDVNYNKTTGKISMTWKLAKNANGDVTYKVSELSSGEVLKRTSDNTFEMNVDRNIPQTYTLYVEASDKDGETECLAAEKYVQISVANTTAPTMGKSWAFATATNMILVVWEKSPSATAAQYKVYRAEDVVGGNGLAPQANPTPIKSTAFNFYYVENLLPNSPYKFIVEVADADGNQSSKKEIITATTDFIQRPPFYGLFDVRKVGGLAGLESLDLYIAPSTDATVTGYQVFRREDTVEYDLAFSAAYQQVAPVGSQSSLTAGPYVPRSVNGVVTERIRVNGMISGRTYCFVVRAFKDGNPVNAETNRLSFCRATNTIKAPFFPGISSVAPAAGAAGFSSLVVNYPPADTDGVMNKWEVSYVGFPTDPGNCANVSFSGATISKTSSEDDLTWPISAGITASNYYCVRVRTLYESGPIYLTDTNDIRKKARAWPAPPSFLGISSIVRATTANGESFDTALISYPAATGSFSRYKIQIGLDANFATLVSASESYCMLNPPAAPAVPCANVLEDKAIYESDRAMTSRTLSGLPKKTVLYFRVTAEFNNANPPASLNDAADAVPPYTPKKLAMDTTPSAPTNDGMYQLNIVNPVTVQVVGVAATNAGATWSENKIWIVSEDTVPGKTAEQAILDYRLHPEWLVNPNLARNTFDTTINGLTAGKRYCVQLRSEYNQGPDTLLSTSTKPALCQTPELLAASFNGVSKVYDKNDSNGWDQLTVEWAPLPSKNNFQQYVVTWSDESAAKADFITNRKTVTNFETGSTNITGMSPNKEMYVRVRVENSFGGQDAIPTGGSTPASTKAAPRAPELGSITGSSAGATTIKLEVYSSDNPDDALPGYPNQKKGLWNNVFFYLAKTDAAIVKNTPPGVVDSLFERGVYNTYIPAYVPAPGDIDYVFQSNGEITLNGGVNLDTGVILRAQRGSPILDAPAKNTLYIKDVPPGTYQIYMRQVYWTGDPDHFVQNGSYFIASAQPQATAPDFSGFKAFAPYHDSQDFAKLNLTWDAAKGECDRMEVIAYESVPGTFDWKNPVATSDCTEVSKALTVDYTGAPLSAHKNYIARARAVNEVLSTLYVSGDTTASAVRKLRPDAPAAPTFTGDSGLTLNNIPNSPDEIQVAWTTPTVGDFNKMFIFANTVDMTVPTPISQAAQIALLQDALDPRTDNKGPTNESLKIREEPTTTPNASMSWTNTGLLAGNRYCYAVVAVYDNRGVGATDNYYVSSVVSKTSVVVGCKNIPFNPPNLLDADFVASFDSNCSDGTPQIRLSFPPGSTLGATPSVDKFQIFVSDTAGSFGDLNRAPAQEIIYGIGDPQDQAASGYIKYGCKNGTIAGDNYFLVRWFFNGGTTVDTATNRYNHTPYNISSLTSNWIWVKKAFSGLAYDFLMHAFEAASLAGSVASDTVSTTAANLVTCESKFHKDGITNASECGTSTSTKTVKSVKSATPMTASFPQAYWACRHSSVTGMNVRLATKEEWTRAAKWPSASYSTMHSTYQSSCNTTSGAVLPSGSNASCKSFVNAYDMAGNLREWTDARLMPYQVTLAEKRFNYAPIIGAMLDNGIDRLTYRYHLITPPAGGVALLMGSDFQSTEAFFPAAGAYFKKQYDPATQYWADPAASNAATGFRCVGFLETGRTVSGAVVTDIMDRFSIPSDPEFTTATDLPGSPANWKVPENQYARDAKIEGLSVNVTNSATPAGTVTITWYPWTKPCVGSCSYSYDIYRFPAPLYQDNRTMISWALIGGPYASDKPLDPLAVNTSGTPIYSSEKIGSALSCASGPCTFTDSTLDPLQMYKYVLVAVDTTNGAAAPARTQRFRSPFYVGDRGLGATATFRDELRIRDGGVYPLAKVFQEAQTTPQHMAHIPMDKSGLDHDFYIQAYEAALAGDLVVDNSAGIANYPLAAVPGSNTWTSDMASCSEEFKRTGLFAAACGSLSTTTGVTKSVQGASVMGQSDPTGVSFSAIWKLCRLSTLAGGTYAYPLYSVANSEWDKAADQGDLNHDKTIDVGPNAGSNVNTIQTGGSSPNCVNAGGPQLAGSRSACQSRYGMFDHVGNVWERTSLRAYANKAFDDGMGGLELDATLVSENSFQVKSTALLDMWRGLLGSATGQISNGPDDYVYGGFGGGLHSVLRGESSVGSPTNGGRFNASYGSSLGAISVTGRCAY